MKIRRLLIGNYRSLRDVLLENVGDVTVLIGANNSGKSNLLEAVFVFFNEFDSKAESKIGSMDEYAWFNKKFDVPIEFALTFELDKVELAEIVPKEVLRHLDVGEKNGLLVKRVITGSPKSAVWRTEEVRVNDVPLIIEAKFAFEPVESDFSEEILQKIAQRVRGRFKLISAARNPPAEPKGISMRESFLQSEILSDLSRMGEAREPSRVAEREWVEEKVKRACRNLSDLRFMGGAIAAREKEGEVHFPIQATGGGYQEIVGLACRLARAEEGVAFGIEEPELHLHPDMIRQFLLILKELSHEHQVFVTTHSTAFVDEADLEDTWIFRKEKNETRVFRMEEPRELKSVLNGLGLRPSDIFYANGLMFVESFTERTVLPIWATRMGVDFGELGVSVIPTYGKASGMYHFKVWVDTAESVGVPYWFILDKSAWDQAKVLKEKLVRGGNLFLLAKGSIEEYYPLKRVFEAVKEEYGITVSEKDRKLESPREVGIENLIRSKGKDPTGWRVAVGRLVAEAMSGDEIDSEIKKVFEAVRSRYEHMFR